MVISTGDVLAAPESALGLDRCNTPLSLSLSRGAKRWTFAGWGRLDWYAAVFSSCWPGLDRSLDVMSILVSVALFYTMSKHSILGSARGCPGSTCTSPVGLGRCKVSVSLSLYQPGGMTGFVSCLACQKGISCATDPLLRGGRGGGIAAVLHGLKLGSAFTLGSSVGSADLWEPSSRARLAGTNVK